MSWGISLTQRCHYPLSPWCCRRQMLLRVLYIWWTKGLGNSYWGLQAWQWMMECGQDECGQSGYIWFSLLIFVWLLTHSLWVENCSLYIWFIIPWNEFQAIDKLLLYQINSLQSYLALNFRTYVIMAILIMPSWELSPQFWPVLLIGNSDWAEPV